MPISSKSPYSVLQGSKLAALTLQNLARDQLPPKILQHLQDVALTTATDGTVIYFPCPFKEVEAAVALKSIEAYTIAAIADVRFGEQKRKIEINVELTGCFLFSTYIATIAGMGKPDPEAKGKLKDSDLLKAQSILYRRFAVILYATKELGKYYHIHGSLEAGKTLNMIGLDAYRPDMAGH